MFNLLKLKEWRCAVKAKDAFNILLTAALKTNICWKSWCSLIFNSKQFEHEIKLKWNFTTSLTLCPQVFHELRMNLQKMYSNISVSVIFRFSKTVSPSRGVVGPLGVVAVVLVCSIWGRYWICQGMPALPWCGRPPVLGFEQIHGLRSPCLEFGVGGVWRDEGLILSTLPWWRGSDSSTLLLPPHSGCAVLQGAWSWCFLRGT